MIQSLKRTTMFSFFFCLLFIQKIQALSGGFYADNGRQQSILYRPLKNNDRVHLQKEILNLLGLHERPKPRYHDLKSSAPKYLLDLYNSFSKNEASNTTKVAEKSRVANSDFIMSFVNKHGKFHKYPHLRHMKEKRLFFDVSHVPPEEDIVGAELRIYKNNSGHEEQSCILSLYCIVENTPNKNSLELVDEISVSNHMTGWLVLNVTGPLMKWIAFPKKNLGLHIKIKSSDSSRSLEPHNVGIATSRGKEEYQPFMVAYFKDLPRARERIRRIRAAVKGRKHDESYYSHDSYNPYAYSSQRYHSKRNCQRLTLYVSFRDLGWQDWIIAPDGFPAFYCAGECSFPLNAHMNATNHAIVQTLVHLMDPTSVPKPSCAPTQLSAITVLYFDDNSNVILKKYKNMVVKSCGCH